MNSSNSRSPLPVSVVVVNYNGKSFLENCLTSLKALDPPAREIILVDNCSSDGSVDWVREHHSWVRVIEAGANLGYCGGNNLGITASSSPFVALLNNDTKVEPDWLRLLHEALNQDPRAAACSSLVILPGDPHLVHYAGSDAHFIGHIANWHYLRPLHEVEGGLVPAEVGVYVGSSVLLRRAALDDVGLLEEELFIYEDELDMCLRFRSRGWRILFHPKSVVWHYSGTPDLAVRVRQRYPSRRAFLVTRNRWLVLLRTYEAVSLLVLAPVLVLFELTWMIAMIVSRNGREFLRGLQWNWLHRRWVAEERKRIQTLRTIHDTELLTARPLTPVPGMAETGFALLVRRAGEWGLRLYWKGAQCMLRLLWRGRRT